MAGILGEADIGPMLADILAMGGAVAVTFGSTTVAGLYDRDAVEIFGADTGPTIAEELVVHIQAGRLPGLVSGSTITVDGAAHRVTRVLPYGDGAMARIVMAR